MKLSLTSLVVGYALCLSISSLAQSAKITSNPATGYGQHLYAQSCAVCHDAHSTTPKAGPGMKNYYSTHHPPPTDTTVRAIIAKGKGTMPGFSYLNQKQMNDLIAYLKTL